MLLHLFKHNDVDQELGVADFPEYEAISTIPPHEFLNRVFDYLSEEDQKRINDALGFSINMNYSTPQPGVSQEMDYSQEPDNLLCDCRYELWIHGGQLNTYRLLCAYELKLEEGENND